MNLFCLELAALLDRSSRPEVFRKKGVLRNFVKLTGKHLCELKKLYPTLPGGPTCACSYGKIFMSPRWDLGKIK